jgi:lipopolysaccharide export LptBFGC system permease protein LptF
MLMTVLMILLVLAVLGAAFGHSRFGAVGWSPVGLLVVVFVVMWFTIGDHFGSVAIGNA